MRKYFFLLTFVCSFSYANKFENARDDRQEILCQEIEIRHGRLWDNDWHCRINSAKEYKNIIGGKSEIDFSKFTLLGVVAGSGGCSAPNITHLVYFNKENNLYQYELTIQQNGNCEKKFTIEHWCLIPKILEA